MRSKDAKRSPSSTSPGRTPRRTRPGQGALPTETEWEHAARGGLDGSTYVWGDGALPGERLANDWRGIAVLRSRQPARGTLEDSYDLAQPQLRVPRKVIKGGSYLCADMYCLRYRPAARRAQMVDAGMSHVGFRCSRSADPA